MDDREYESEAELEPMAETKQQPVREHTVGNRGQGQVQKLKQQQSPGQLLPQAPDPNQSHVSPPGALREEERRTGHIGGPYGVIRQSRIKDRPVKPEKDSSVKIKIELDLEVEVDLYARVKGDIMIGLM
jgi:hypothetical protein